MNFLDGRIEAKDGGLRARVGETCRSRSTTVEPSEKLEDGRAVTVGVRPHDVTLAPEGGGAPFDVALIEALGAESYAHGSFGGAPFVARLPASAPVKKGDQRVLGHRRAPPLRSRVFGRACARRP